MNRAAGQRIGGWNRPICLNQLVQKRERLLCRMLRRVQQLYLKCIRHFVENYDRYREWMPVSARVGEILALCRGKPYRPGTYRTDFVIDEANQIRLIETTCRFAMNGYFTSGFFIHNLADRFLAAWPGSSICPWC